MLPVSAGAAADKSEKDVRLYNVYGNHMLFQQNEDAVFAGYAPSGTGISVVLKDSDGNAVCSSESVAGESGSFTVSFRAPGGSFRTYTAELSANGNGFCTLSDIVFGELWLSSGQSNMEYTLSGTPEGRDMISEGRTGRNGIRFMSVPHKMKDGSVFADADPQREAEGCYWFAADSSDVYNMSAAAYFFAESMLDRLNVPVGILNTAVGGSGIVPWIPRQAIESDTEILASLKEIGAYISREDWDSGKRDYIGDMTGLFNSKIAPLQNFRPAGLIWYQGETEIFKDYDPSLYTKLFSLLQDSYTSLFNHEAGRMPAVFSQLAVYNYGKGPYAVTRLNDAFTSLVKDDPSSRGEAVIHDILPEYDKDNHPIHPNNKKPVGERMALCAYNLVYDGEGPCSSPYMTEMNVRGESVYVKFAQTGEGLISRDKYLRGFSVYGKSGVCAAAQAEIVSEDTVRVYSTEISEPKGAAYAVNSVSLGASLYSSSDGELCLPAASFGCSDKNITRLFDDAEWLYCDSLSAWQCRDAEAGFREIWKGQNASVSVSGQSVQGDGSIEIRADKNSFSVSAVLYEDTKSGKIPYGSFDSDFSDYAGMSVSFRNSGTSSVTLRDVRIRSLNGTYYSPVCRESGEISAVIPADGKWHEYTFDLNRLAPLGTGKGSWSNEILDSVASVEFRFSGDGAVINCDNIIFTPESGGANQEGPFIQRVFSFFADLPSLIKNFFENLFR